MTESFDPLEFLEIAKQQGNADGATEAMFRTAINRAYYATFWIARKRTGVMVRKDVHWTVIGALKGKSGLRVESKRLEALYKLRGNADYDQKVDDPYGEDWARDWSKAISFAEYIIKNLTKE